MHQRNSSQRNVISVPVSLANDTIATEELARKIVGQLAEKSISEQEVMIERLLKLLDSNLLVALQVAYTLVPEKK